MPAIIEDKRAEDALRENEARYRTLFDLAPIAVYSCDATGVIRDYNNRAAELWGRNLTDKQYFTGTQDAGATFSGPKFLDRTLDSAAARCVLLGRYYPADPFVPRQRRQILPSRLRRRSQSERRPQVRRSLVNGTGFTRCAYVQHFIVTVGRS